MWVKLVAGGLISLSGFFLLCFPLHFASSHILVCLLPYVSFINRIAVPFWCFMSKPCDNFSIARRKALSRENSKARRVKILWLHRMGKLRAGSLQNASLFLHSLMQDRSAVLFLLMPHYFGLRSLVTVGPDHIIVFWTRVCTACSGVTVLMNYLVVRCCGFGVLWVLIHLTLSSRKHPVPSRTTVELEPVKSTFLSLLFLSSHACLLRFRKAHFPCVTVSICCPLIHPTVPPVIDPSCAGWELVTFAGVFLVVFFALDLISKI